MSRIFCQVLQSRKCYDFIFLLEIHDNMTETYYRILI